MVNCSVIGCSSRSEQKYENITFHTFPLDESVRNTWLAATGRQNWHPTKYSRICSKHFEDCCFRRTQQKVYVDKFSTPTFFVHSENEVPWPAGSSSAGTPLPGPRSLDSNVKLEDPLAIEPPHTNDTTPQCRFCAGFSKDCVVVTDKDRPYLTRNKTALTISDLSVELDFNNALPKTVCRACDSKLLEMFKFVKQVKEAQDSLINVRDYVIESDTVVVKNECESPTPDDSDDIDSKDDIVDCLTVTDTVFVKPIIKHKRKRIESTKTHKNPKVTKDVESEDAEIIIDIKEETAELAEMVDTYETENVEFDDTEMDTKPSELELQTLLKLMK